MNNVPTVTKIDGCDDLFELPTGLLLCHSTMGHQVVCGEEKQSVLIWILESFQKVDLRRDARGPTNERVKKVKQTNGK